MSKACKKCGGTVGQQDQFCIHCGTPLEKEPLREERRNDDRAEVLSMGDYLLMLILLAIPVVNFIVGILWIVNKSGNPNRRNFAKAWMILAVIGTILSGILAYGLFQFIVMDHYVDIHHHMEYSIPEEMFMEEFLMELNEV